MTVISYTGTVHKGKVEPTTPIDLPEGSEVYIVAKIGVTQQAARRKVTGWLVDHVGNLVMADEGTLVQSNQRWIWRFQAYLTSLGQPPQGPIGEVELDANSGEILNTDQDIERMYRRGERLSHST